MLFSLIMKHFVKSGKVILSVLFSVEGGELFERIVDESCPLTEVDAMVFVKQICEGVQYMHQMYVLHLDLKVMQFCLPIMILYLLI